MADPSGGHTETIIAAITSIAAAIGSLKLFDWWKASRTARQSESARLSEQRASFVENLQSEISRKDQQIEALQLTVERTAHDMRAENMRQADQIARLLASIQNSFASWESLPIALWSKDLAGVRRYQNPAYEKLTGYAAKDCIGKTDRQILGDDVPEDLARNWLNHDREILASPDTIMRVVELVSHKASPGRVFRVLVYKWADWHRGRVVGTSGFAIELSEVEQAIAEHTAEMDRISGLKAEDYGTPV